MLDFPLPFHKNASKAAEAAHCAGEQGKYWEMHDQLFANQNALDPTNLSEYAKKIELDVSKFQQCLDSGKYAEAIKKEMAEGQKAGITGVPAFLMGLTDPKNPKTIKATKKISGAQPYAEFKKTIDGLLSPQK